MENTENTENTEKQYPSNSVKETEMSKAKVSAREFMRRVTGRDAQQVSAVLRLNKMGIPMSSTGSAQRTTYWVEVRHIVEARRKWKADGGTVTPPMPPMPPVPVSVEPVEHPENHPAAPVQPCPLRAFNAPDLHRIQRDVNRMQNQISDLIAVVGRLVNIWEPTIPSAFATRSYTDGKQS